MNLRKKRKGMNPMAGLVFFGLAIVLFLYLAVGMLGGMKEGSYERANFTNETHKINTSELPVTVQVDHVKDGVYISSELLYPPGNKSESLGRPENYTVKSWEDGKFEIWNYKNDTGVQEIDFEYDSKDPTSMTRSSKAGLGVFYAFSGLIDTFAYLIIAGIIFLVGYRS